MLTFSPCMDIFFNDLPFPERLEKIASIGYKKFEFWTWWDKDVNEILEAKEKNGLSTGGFCTKFISLVDESQRDEYLKGLEETIDVAKKLGAGFIISQVGNELTDIPRDKQKYNLIEGLKAASGMLEDNNLTLVFEPLNILYDHGGYYLSRSAEAFEIAKAVNSPNVKILFDVYHQQATEGNIMNNIKDYWDEIGHFHIADHPGRHEIGSGEINYKNVLNLVESKGYKGSVGIELFPENPDHEAVLSDKMFVKG